MFYIGLAVGFWTAASIFAVIFNHGACTVRDAAERAERDEPLGAKA